MSIITLIIESCAKSFRESDGCVGLFFSENGNKIVIEAYNKVVKPALIGIYDFIMKNPSELIEKNFNALYIATLLRFVYYFRIYLAREELPVMLKFCCDLKSNLSQLNNVIQQTAIAFLDVRHGNFAHFVDLVPFFNSDSFEKYAEDVLKMVHRIDSQSKTLAIGSTRIL